jgi:hypothetical protein
MNLRSLLFTVLVSVFSLNVNAQIATPEKGSKWVYDYGNIGSRGPVLATYERDSIIDGKKSLIISERLYDVYTNPGKPELVIRKLTGKTLAIEDSVVYYYHNSQYDTLINFGADIGDSWKNGYSRDTITANVLGKGKDSVLGSFLDIEYSYWPDRPDIDWSYRDTVYEVLLGGREYPIPADIVASQLDGHEGGPLQCFSNSQGRYSDRVWTAGGAACTDIIEKLDVPELSNTKNFAVYPNPSAGKIYLKSITNELPKRVSVMDAKAAIVYEAETLDQLSDLFPQLYFVKIVRQDGGVEVHRVVVE